jgi:hypothetical protein
LKTRKYFVQCLKEVGIPGDCLSFAMGDNEVLDVENLINDGTLTKFN